MKRITQYVDPDGRIPFDRWFNGLSTPAALKITTALGRLEAGNLSALKSVGQGVHEIRVDFGPGYRVYVGLDGADWVVLLGGSAKARQSAAIAQTQARWKDYRQRKRNDR